MLGQNLATPSSRPAAPRREEYASRRGACPGLSAPMPTGDGLLVRLLPSDTIALEAFVALGVAAQTHGNGVIEITSRGSIQVRGLTPESAQRFAAAVTALGIAAPDGIPVLSDVLAGLDPADILDAEALARDLRHALTPGSLSASVSPKVSVAIDGGGSLRLDEVAADVRLCAEIAHGSVVLRTSVGGDSTNAAQLGLVPPTRGVDAAVRLLEVIAQRGAHARARDVLAAEGLAPFRAALAIAGGSSELPLPNGQRKRNDAIGMHPLRDQSLASGIGLAFGHAGAASLQQLIEAAQTAGARGVRAAPGRVLMFIGLAREAASAFAAGAELLGFITRADDPRRYVFACAGSPVCAAAHIAARAMAPAIAATAAPFLDRSFTIHISGCAKGCAHPAAAALTVVGTSAGCALVANGSTRDLPHAVVSADKLPAAIANYARRRTGESNHV
jgi:precorrin-3B synthase